MKINTPRFNQILGRMLSMSGVQDPAGDLSPEVSAIIALEVDRPEWVFLGNGRLWGNCVDVTISAGLAGGIRIRNPVGSGVLSIIEAVSVSTLTTFGVRMVVNNGSDTTDLANLMTNGTRDSRSTPLSGVGATKVSWSNAAPGGVTILDGVFIAINTRVPFECFPVVLSPGFSLNIGTSDLNIRFNVNIRGRERAMETYELPS